MFYIFRNGEVIQTDDLMEWAKSQQASDRNVASTQVGVVRISTDFLGIDHGFGGAPVLFETMVFRGELYLEYYRYHTLEEAMQGHERMVARVRGDVEPAP